MKLILHIGSAKTGTSTLQTSLRGQASALLEQGILYPTTGFSPVANQSAIALEAITRGVPRIFLQNGALSDQDVTELYEASWRNIEAQIENANPHTVVLSSEFLFLTKYTADLDPLLTRIRDMFDDAQVACYLRSPESFFASKSLQILRGATRLPRPGKFSYLGVLDSYQAYFPTRARVYARDALIDGDIVQDFMTCYLPDVTMEPVKDEANISISAEGMYVATEIRKRFMKLPENKFTPGHTLLVRRIGRMEAVLGIKKKPELQPWVLQELYRHFEPEREALSEKYGIEFPPVTIDETADPLPGSDLSCREVFALDDDIVETIMLRMAFGDVRKDID